MLKILYIVALFGMFGCEVQLKNDRDIEETADPDGTESGTGTDDDGGSTGGGSANTGATSFALSGGTVGLYNVQGDEITLTWTPATNDSDSNDEISYLVCYDQSESNIETEDGCLDSTIALDWATGTLTVELNSLTPGTTFYFNVLARNSDGAIESLGTFSQTTKGVSSAFSMIDMGWWHSVGISGGRLYCWGDNGNGQCGVGNTDDVLEITQVGTATNWIDVDTYMNHTCGVKSDGTLWCWGDNSMGQLGIGSTTSTNTPTQVGSNSTWDHVTAGEDHSCATRSDGTLWCWGEADRVGDGSSTRRTSPVQIGAATNWDKLAAGEAHTCATNEDGELWCWGVNGHGRLGDNSTTLRLAPVRVGTDSDWIAITAGDDGTCGIRSATTEGTLWCWGRGVSGQLGLGVYADPNVPTAAGADTDWIMVHITNSATCGVKSDGTRHCWGDDTNGQHGNGKSATTAVLSPTQSDSDTDWAYVAPGHDHGCGLKTDGRLFCWGEANQGQVGIAESQFTQVESVNDWLQLAAGGNHTCGIRQDRSLYCWGSNVRGELGIGSTPRYTPTPTRVGSANDWRVVSTGYQVTCAINTNNELFCWGMNGSGQQGIGADTTDRDTPRQVGSDTDWADVVVSTGGSRVYARKSDGTLFGAGENGTGRLGDGTTTDRDTFTQLGVASNWTQIGAGSSHACALNSDGEIYCWGENGQGEVGDGTTTDRSSPTRLGADSDWTQVVVSSSSSFALKSSGVVYGWGDNLYGQLGDGTNTDRSTPVQVGSRSDWAEVYGGGNSACLKATDGSYFCLGYNSDGQLGIGNETNQSTPTAMTVNSSDWEGLTVGGSFMCMTTSTGIGYCWGDNREGQHGAIGTYTPLLIAAP